MLGTERSLIVHGDSLMVDGGKIMIALSFQKQLKNTGLYWINTVCTGKIRSNE